MSATLTLLNAFGWLWANGHHQWVSAFAVLATAGAGAGAGSTFLASATGLSAESLEENGHHQLLLSALAAGAAGATGAAATGAGAGSAAATAAGLAAPLTAGVADLAEAVVLPAAAAGAADLPATATLLAGAAGAASAVAGFSVACGASLLLALSDPNDHQWPPSASFCGVCAQPVTVRQMAKARDLFDDMGYPQNEIKNSV